MLCKASKKAARQSDIEKKENNEKALRPKTPPNAKPKFLGLQFLYMS